MKELLLGLQVAYITLLHMLKRCQMQDMEVYSSRVTVSDLAKQPTQRDLCQCRHALHFREAVLAAV